MNVFARLLEPGAFPPSQKRRAELHDRSRGVTALLGPTNTGKTHYAIERMLQHPSGIIGLPLRLLAREVYQRIVEKAGVEAVALVTGEEKIKPAHPRYWIATVEAMPRDLDVSFVAIDEIQLCADLDRGHVFTDRLLNRRGREETLVIGAETMRPAIEALLPGARIVTRPRLSQLVFAGSRKLSRLPPRSAIVAFSAEDVYAIAELMRRQRGGAAVVMGALSPRTRNAQVELYQSGEVDYIVATDAIGMGLNLDVDHVAFAADRKFDGWQHRRLNPAEFGQIAGRAGRYTKDGTFGTGGRCPPFDDELVEMLEQHRFDPVPILQWRNTDLDFSSITDLQASLDRLPQEEGLTRAPLGEDILVLDMAARDAAVQRNTKTRADVARLWETCQIPDYRKTSPAAHADLALTIYGFVVRAGKIPDAWFSTQINALDRTDGDIDALSARIAQVRTCTYIANRPDWLSDPKHWQGVARQVEDNLSDALHERLSQRFIDRRTSVLMRRLRENAMLDAEITAAGDVMVEGQHIGQLQGFRFTPDPQAAGEAARALNAAGQKALAGEIEARATRVHEAVDDAFALANDGVIRWLGEIVGKIAAGEKTLEPQVRVLADEQLTGEALEKVQRRLDLWLKQHIEKRLGALNELETGEGLEGIARGIAFQVGESLGVLERARVAEDVRGLSQEARGALRKLGVRFGAYHLYMPQLLKPAPRALAAQLWALKHGGVEAVKGLDEVPHLAASGRTSFAADKDVPKGLYRAAGFRVCGERAVRVDILERLADLIRPAIAYRPGQSVGDAPPGAADGDGFVVTVQMTSLAGCAGEDFASILKSLGYQAEQRKGPAITVPLIKAAATEPARAATPSPAEGEDGAADTPLEIAASADTETLAAEAPVIETAPETQDVPALPEPQEDIGADTDAEPASTAAAEPAETSGEIPAEAPRAEATAEVLAETPAEAASPAPAEAAPDAAEPAPAEEEEKLIEVWRQSRQAHGRRDGQRSGRPRGEQRQGQGPRRFQRPESAPAEGSPRSEGGRPRNGERQGRPGGQRGEGQRPHGARPQSDRPRGERGPRERDQNRGQRAFSTEAPRPRERQPDPDSPFAKLLALKSQLETRDKKD